MKVWVKRKRSFGRLGERQQLFTRNQIDLVEHQNFIVIDAREFRQDRVGLLVDTCLGVDQGADQIASWAPLHAVDTMARSSRRFRRKDSRRIDQNDLGVVSITIPRISARVVCTLRERS